MAIYKYVKITLTVLKFLIYRKEFFGMRKFTLDAWDRHIANIQIEGYGQGLAQAKMMATVNALIIALECQKITREEYRLQLDNNGFGDWSETALREFANGKTPEVFESYVEKNIEIWWEYCEKGEKQIRGRLNGYRDLQNEIYKYACETGILNNPVLTGPQLDVEVILARMMRQQQVYEDVAANEFSICMGIDMDIIMDIFKILQFVDFDIYGYEYVEKKDDEYDHMITLTKYITGAVVTITELIYRAALRNIDVSQYVSERVNSVEHREEIINLIKILLDEHIQRMDKILKEYPKDVIYGMLGYPLLEQAEYEQCIVNINTMLHDL